MKGKRLLTALLTVTAVFTLCSCAGNASPSANNTPAVAESTLNLPQATDEPVPSSRLTELGYIAEEIPTPDYVTAFGACDVYDDGFYLVADTPDGKTLVCFDTRTQEFERIDVDLSMLHNPNVFDISVSADSIWLHVIEAWSAEEQAQGLFTGETNVYIVHLDRATGVQSVNPMLFGENTSLPATFLIALDAEHALIGNQDFETKTFLIDKNASVLATPDVVIAGKGRHAWVGGKLYIESPDGLAAFNSDTLGFNAVISDLPDTPAIYSSPLDHLLFTADNTLFSVDLADGETSELFHWANVALGLSRLYGNVGLENADGDIYHYTDRITRITSRELPQKETLILACLGDTSAYGYPSSDYFGASNKSYVCSDALMDAIIRFNNSDPDYKIELRPYIYNNESERTRLLIELATGKEVDILDTSLLPDDAADGSILVDMLPFLDADEDISRDDFIPGIFADMTKNGGLYEYVDRYNLITVTARKAFAEGGKWTADRACDILAQHPDLRIQNDPEALCDYFAWAASAEYIDYESGTCAFSSETFVQWLALLNRLAHTDCEWNSDPYRGEYAMYIDNAFPVNIGRNSREKANGEYTPVGYPNSVGTGSYFMRYGAPTAYGSWSFLPNGERGYGAVSSVGIMSSSDKIEGAWRFIKTFMSGMETVTLNSGIPAQKAAFERAVENALLREQGEFSYFEEFDESDAEAIRYLVYNTSACVSDSNVVLDTIRAAMSAYVGGVYSAEETAAQLQSRISIYLAEQFG